MATATARATEKKAETPATSALDPTTEQKIRSLAFKEIGGIPKNYLKSTVTPITSNSYRVNIYTQEEGENFVKLNKIAHSLFLKV